MPIELTVTLVMEVVSGLLIVAGCLFFLAGTVGLLRFPDLYCRLHALTKADTLGLGLIVAGLVIRNPAWPARVQLVLIWMLALSAAATVCHLLARSSLAAGIEPIREPGGASAGVTPAGEGR
ncbi:MAG: monovalent cation/H(+) antiporter subunit G [Gemmatimonadales bacterium]|nr:MAG: monovalent cation/H(+) antiporter subunit G [Gemmatimonadales bacterium]